MSTKPISEPPRTELRSLSQAEVARLVRQAQRLRGEYVAGLARSLGHRLARTLAALAAPARATRGAAGKT